MPRTLLAALTALFAVTFAVSPYFVSDFGGFDPNQFPVPQDDPPVQPAGYAFGIWGLIYLWLVVGLGWGFLKRRNDAQWHKMRLPLALSLAVGTAWLAVAVASAVWAGILIWIMLIAALAALFRAPQDDTFWAAWPVGLYAGWLSAASCVSLGLLAAGYDFADQNTAAYGAILLAIILAAAVQSTLRRTPTYGLAVIWALVAVVVQNMATQIGVAGLAAGGAIALLLPTWRAWRST